MKIIASKTQMEIKVVSFFLGESSCCSLVFASGGRFELSIIVWWDPGM